MSANRDVIQANLLAGRFVAGQPQPMPKDKFWPALALVAFTACLSVLITAMVVVQVMQHWRGALWCALWLFAFGYFLGVRKAKR